MVKSLNIKLKDPKIKQAFVWLYFYNRLERLQRGFYSQLRGYFSNLKKDVLSSDTFTFNKDKWLKEFTKMYAIEVTKSINLGKNRAEAEMTDEERENLNYHNLTNIYANFIAEYSVISGHSVLTTTERKINEIVLNKEIEDKKAKIEEIFEKWKSWRTKMIAKTELYRGFNFSYLEAMKMVGYSYKQWFNPPSEKNCKACERLTDVIVGIESSFVEFDERDRLFSGKYPPIHPNNDAIIFCLKNN